MFKFYKKPSPLTNYTDIKTVKSTLNNLKFKMISNIKNDYNLDIDIYTDKKRANSSTSIYKPLYMRISVKDIYDNMTHRQVRNQDFVRTVLALYHENTHVFQNKELFQQEHPDNLTKIMAIQKVIGTVIPEYYDKTYWESNLFEIHAERRGISDTVEYFNHNFPEIDVEKELVNIINSEDYWYGKRPVQSLEDAYNKLDKQAEKSLTANVQLYKNSFGLDQNSPAFQAFYQQTDMDSFNEKSADEQRDILLQFVAEYTPSVIRHYKALSDIQTADGPDRIPLDGELYRKPATTPQETKHAQRMALLMETLGNIPDTDDTLNHDNSPEFE